MATQCPKHPGVPTTDLCVGCGEFVCGQCAYVASDRRVFCPSCKDLLSAEELAGLTPPAPGQPGPGLASPQRPAPGRAPVVPVSALEVLPAVEVQSQLWLAVKASPLSVVVGLLGLVGFASWPVAIGGAALGLHLVKRHFQGDAHGHTGLVVGSFAVCAVAVLWHLGSWTGR